jgi:hypothetical protein
MSEDYITRESIYESVIQYVDREIEKGRLNPAIKTDLHHLLNMVADTCFNKQPFNKSSGVGSYKLHIMQMVEHILIKNKDYIIDFEIKSMKLTQATMRLVEEYNDIENEVVANGEKYKFVSDLVNEFLNEIITKSGRKIDYNLIRIFQICKLITNSIYETHLITGVYSTLSLDDPLLIIFIRKLINYWFVSYWVVDFD